MSINLAGKFLRRMAPAQSHDGRREFQRAADNLDEAERLRVENAEQRSHIGRADAREERVRLLENEIERLKENWARALLARDKVQGREALRRMLEWYDIHDGLADDYGELFIVKDARKALDDTN